MACLLDVDSVILYSRDYTRALFILLQNPIFASQSTFTILAHLLQHLTGLPNSDHQLLVHWFRNLAPSRFKLILRNLLQVILIIHNAGTENLKKSGPKKLVKSNKSISQNFILTKIHFWQCQKWPKINIFHDN